MSILKYKIPKSVVTNIDSSDANLEVAAELMNMKAQQGYLEGKTVSWGNEESMPDLPGWSIETGIYAYISTDQYSVDVKAIKTYRVRLLVYLLDGTPNNAFTRKVMYKEEGDQVWLDVASLCTDWGQGSTETQFTTAYMGTDVEGKTLLINEDGVVKIYMPHDTFWFGRLKRSIDISKDKGKLDIAEGYYLERLVEPINLLQQPSIENNLLAGNERLGINFQVKQSSDVTPDIGAPCTFTLEGSSKPAWEDLESYFLTTSYSAVDDTTGDDILNDMVGAGIYGGGTPIWGFIQQYDDSGVYQNKLIAPISITKRFSPTGGWGGISTEVDTDTVYGMYHQKGRIDPDGHPDPDYEMPLKLANYTPDTKVLLIDDTALPGTGWQSLIAGELDDGGGWGGETTQVQALDVLYTLMLDYKTEIIVAYSRFEPLVDRDNPAYSLAVTITLPENINKRVTNLKVYVKEVIWSNENLDYEEVKNFDLQSSKTPFYYTFNVYSVDLSGRSLFNATNFFFEDDKPEKYRIINKVEDRAISRGYSICTSNEYRITPFHCAIGNGQIMTDLFYLTTAILTSLEGTIIALESTEGKLFAITEKSTYLIHVGQLAGYPTFDILEQLEYGIKFRHDAIKVQGGILLFTIDGIFLTNGQQSQLISRDINNILEYDYYDRDKDKPSIFYNSYEHQLLYVPQKVKPIDYDEIIVQEYGFIYSFRRQGWETTNPDAEYLYGSLSPESIFFLLWVGEAKNYFKNMKAVVEDWDGLTAIIKSDGIVKGYLTAPATVESNIPAVGIKSHLIDLSELSMQKRLNDIWIDYEVFNEDAELQLVVVGQGTAYRDLEGLSYAEGDLEKIYFTNMDVDKDNELPVLTGKRMKLRLPVPIDKRKKYTTLRFVFSSDKPEVRLYGIEFEFEAGKEDNINYE